MSLLGQNNPEFSGETSPQGAGCLPLRTKPDLEMTSIGFGGRISYIVKDPIGLKYHRLQPVQYKLLELLRGPRTLEELQLELNAFEPASQFEIRDVQQMLADFHEKGIVVSLRPGQGTQLYQLKHKHLRQKIKQTLQSILFLRIPGWSPGKVLDRLDPLQKVLFHPVSVCLMLGLIAAAMLLVVREYAVFQSKLPGLQSFFSWQNLPYMWLSVICAKIVHEFGHAFVCRHFGAQPHQIGIMLLVLTPTMYCDVTDSWMLKNKWQRMAIGLGGAFLESVLASIALFVWWWTEPGSLNFFCLNLFTMSAITNTVFNLNPLVRFDGYYILSDYLEIPNLKQQSDQAMRRAFCRYGLGVELPRDPLLPESGNPWLVVYGIAAWCYRWVIMFGITILLYVLLKPYGLQQFSFLLLFYTLGMMVWGMFRGIRQSLKQIQPIQPAPGRYVLLGLLGVAAVAIIGFVPIPYWITCSFELEPQGIVHLYTLSPGNLQEVRVKPGDRVQAGDVLLRLHNPDLDDQLRKELMDLELQQNHLLVARLKHDDEQIATALEQIQSIQTRLQNIEEKKAQLIITAPVAGTIFPSPRVPERFPNLREKLPQWGGTIFDIENQNAWIDKATPVLSIAPSEKMQAVLLIDQNDRNDMETGQPVLLQCRPIVGAYWQSHISEIGHRETDQAPSALTQKSGGDIATVTDEQGREKMLSAAYRGVVPLPEAGFDPLPLMGTTGTARVVISHRTAAGWAWRLLSQTFRFRL